MESFERWLPVTSGLKMASSLCPQDAMRSKCLAQLHNITASKLMLSLICWRVTPCTLIWLIKLSQCDAFYGFADRKLDCSHSRFVHNWSLTIKWAIHISHVNSPDRCTWLIKYNWITRVIINDRVYVKWTLQISVHFQLPIGKPFTYSIPWKVAGL